MSQLVTGEAVVLDLRLAKLPSRAIAFTIDLIALTVVGIPVLFGLAWAIPEANDALVAALLITMLVLLLVGVPTAVETISRGRSLGKLVMGLRVVRDDGGPITLRHALTRALAGLFLDFYTTSGAGAVICSLLNSKGKRIGDLLAGTVVVRESTPDTTGPMAQMPPALASWAVTLELSRLPSDLALSARHYLARMPQLVPEVQESMGAQLATAVASYVSPPAPPGTPAWAYLAAVLAERRRREELRWAGITQHNHGWGTTPSGHQPVAQSTRYPGWPTPESPAHPPAAPGLDSWGQPMSPPARPADQEASGFAPPD